jgi:hypothetical protein
MSFEDRFWKIIYWIALILLVLQTNIFIVTVVDMYII